MQRTCADWKDATDYSVLCSEHFTSDCFEEDSFIAAQFGLTKRKRLKSDAVPTIFHKSTLNVAATSHGHLQEGPSAVGHKRAALAEESIPLKKKKAAFEKREGMQLRSYRSRHGYIYGTAQFKLDYTRVRQLHDSTRF